MNSSQYVIWKDQAEDAGPFPWHFEGTEYGDTGSCASFEEALAATVGGVR